MFCSSLIFNYFFFKYKIFPSCFDGTCRVIKNKHLFQISLSDTTEALLNHSFISSIRYNQNWSSRLALLISAPWTDQAIGSRHYFQILRTKRSVSILFSRVFVFFTKHFGNISRNIKIWFLIEVKSLAVSPWWSVKLCQRYVYILSFYFFMGIKNI